MANPGSTRADSLDLEAPPYDDVSEASTTPPSYDSLYGRVKAAREESSGTFDFLKTFLFIILSTVGFTILIGISMAIPVSMIAIGAVYLDDCPCERMIPIYLIVAGCFGAAKNLFSVITRCCNDGDPTTVNPIASAVDTFLFAWFIAGCVYIYRTKDEFVTDDKDSDKYCDPTLYWFAFWITIAVYIITAASCCCCCLVGGLAACFLS